MLPIIPDFLFALVFPFKSVQVVLFSTFIFAHFTYFKNCCYVNHYVSSHL